MFSTAFTYMASSGPNLWTPAQISTAFWVDANDISTITLSGSNVSQWNDKSGNGNNAVQATPANQPTYSSTGFNSKPAVSFNGSNERLTVATGTFGSSISIFVVTNESAALSEYRRILNIGDSVDAIGYFGSINGNFATFFGDGSNWNDADTNSPSTTIKSNNILEVVNPTSGSNATPYVNGTAQNTKVGTMGTATGLVIGASIVPNQFSVGPVAEIVIVNSGVSTTVRQQIEGYLAWKWGLEGNLPNDHPYKNEPPTI